MKSLFNNLLVTCGLVAAFSSYGQQCGQVSTNMITLKNDQYRVVILNGGKKAKGNSKGVAVVPGKHRFEVVAVSKSRDTQFRQNMFSINGYDQLSEVLDIEIDVKADRIYRIVAKVIDPAVLPRNRRYKVEVAYESEKPCDALEVLPKLTNVVTKTTVELPQQLEYRLNLVMKDLQQFYHSQGIKLQNVEINREPKLIDVLGVVLDQQFDSADGLKILAVTPTSLAANIGLQPNDVIVQINQLELTYQGKGEQPTQRAMTHSLKLALSQVTKEKEAVLVVKRNNQLKQLAVKFSDVTLPGYQLQLQLE